MLESSNSLAGHTEPPITQSLLISLASFLMTFELPPPPPRWSHSHAKLPESGPWGRFISPWLYSQGEAILSLLLWAITQLWTPPPAPVGISPSLLYTSTVYHETPFIDTPLSSLVQGSCFPYWTLRTEAPMNFCLYPHCLALRRSWVNSW